MLQIKRYYSVVRILYLTYAPMTKNPKQQVLDDAFKSIEKQFGK